MTDNITVDLYNKLKSVLNLPDNITHFTLELSTDRLPIITIERPLTDKNQIDDITLCFETYKLVPVDTKDVGE